MMNPQGLRTHVVDALGTSSAKVLGVGLCECSLQATALVCWFRRVSPSSRQLVEPFVFGVILHRLATHLRWSWMLRHPESPPLCTQMLNKFSHISTNIFLYSANNIACSGHHRRTAARLSEPWTAEEDEVSLVGTTTMSLPCERNS